MSQQMPNPPGPQRPVWSDPGLRVSDAERAEVADRLASHYSDGRLDDAEFDERLDRAMRAKTRAELSWLLADLPADRPAVGGPSALNTGGKRHQRRMLKLQIERERVLLRHERREARRAGWRQHGQTLRLLVLCAAFLLVAVVVAHVLTHLLWLWVLVAVLVFLWLRRRPGGYGSQ